MGRAAFAVAAGFATLGAVAGRPLARPKAVTLQPAMRAEKSPDRGWRLRLANWSMAASARPTSLAGRVAMTVANEPAFGVASAGLSRRHSTPPERIMPSQDKRALQGTRKYYSL